MAKPPKPLSISPSQFDATWFSKACEEWDSGASNVIVVETSDFDREQQLIYCVQRIYASLGRVEDVHLFEPWTGLLQWYPGRNGGEFAPVSRSAGGAAAYDPGAHNAVRDLQDSLQHMDRILSSRPGALILRNVEQVNNHSLSDKLAEAIRSWALNQALAAHRSMICLLTSSPGAVLDPTTLKKAILVSPELASTSERRQLIDIFNRHHSWGLDSDGVESLATGARGLGLGQLRRILQSCGMAGERLDHARLKDAKASALGRSEALDIEEPSFGFEAVGGYQAVKDLVSSTLIRALRHPERARMAAIAPPRGLLLFGPPGTGKTLFARAMARETRLPFINLRTENIFTPLLGESGQNLREAIRLIEEASPALVFIDEIDRLGKRGGGGHDGASQETKRVFGQMLEWLGDEKRKSVIVGATNEPDQIDDAFMRPGRFSFLVPFLYPDRHARRLILAIHLGMEGGKRRPHMNEGDVRHCLDEIAAGTKYYSGAEIETIVDGAKRRFFESTESALSARHLQAAFHDFRIDPERRREQVERYLAYARRFGTSAELLARMERFD